jgi:ABC-type polar amino acid transport system ATPase subunit
MSSFILDIHALKKSFGPLEVLKGVDLQISSGEVLCLIGASGSGKSTILRCINGLELAQGGSIHFKGELIDYHNTSLLPALRAQMGMVFQHFHLFPHLSVVQNIMEAPLRVKKMAKTEARKRALSLLEKVGLLDKQDEFPARLSGGQKQRVAIARALAMEPDVLLFDEPTSALDPETVGSVLEVMRALALEGRTMVIVTHEMDFARAVANRIAFVHEGVIHEINEARALLDSPQKERTQEFLRAVGLR